MRVAAPLPATIRLALPHRAGRLVERNLLLYRRTWMVLFSGFFEPLLYLFGIGYGLGALVGLMRSLKKEGRRFILVGLQPDLRTVLAITHLDKLLEIQPRLEDALNRLRTVT